MAQPLLLRLEKRLAAWRWQRAALLAGVSLVLALALVGYLFGAGNGFFGRLFSAFFVFFWLLGLIYYAIVPFVSWASDNWFGRRWQVATGPQPRRAPAGSPRGASSQAAPRRPHIQK